MKRTFILGLILALFFSLAPAQNDPQHQDPINPDEVKVWVNTASRVYHCPGSNKYGKTKRGKYMTQKDARQQGYRPSANNPCAEPARKPGMQG